MVVVVLHELPPEETDITVVYTAPSTGDVGERVVVRVHAVDLAEGEPGAALLTDVHHPGGGALGAVDAGGRVVGLLGGVGVLAIAPAAVVFAVEVEAEGAVDLQAGAGDMGGRRQSVVEAHGAQVGEIADIAFGLGDEEQHGLVVVVGLLVRGDPYLVVVAQLELELDRDDLRLGKARPVEEIGTVEVVDQDHLFGAIGGDEALPDETALDDRFEADLAAPVHGAVLIGDDDVRPGREIGSSPLAVLGRIVTQHELDETDGLVLAHRQLPGEGVPARLVAQGVRVVGVDGVEAHLDVVAYQAGDAPAEQRGVVRVLDLPVGRGVAALAADARIQHRGLYPIGGQVDL